MSSTTIQGRDDRAAAVTAAQMMETRVVTVRDTALLSEVEQLLAKHRVSGMPVVDADGRAVGVVSYRDLLDRAQARAADRRRRRPRTHAWFHDPENGGSDIEAPLPAARGRAKAADVMTPALIDVEPAATLEEVARTMVRHSVHRVLVLEPGTRRVLGIISSLRVLAAIAR